MKLWHYLFPCTSINRESATEQFHLLCDVNVIVKYLWARLTFF